jgi:hypothetical protein
MDMASMAGLRITAEIGVERCCLAAIDRANMIIQKLLVHDSKRRKGTSSRKRNCPFRIVAIDDPEIEGVYKGGAP